MAEAFDESWGPKRKSVTARVCNIAVRTMHLIFTGILVGGHFFSMPPERLRPLLYLVIASGIGLIAAEAYPNWRWCCEVCAWMVFSKLGLMCLIPWQWDHRLVFLLAIAVIGSIGSHMPKHFRHYRIIPCRR